MLQPLRRAATVAIVAFFPVTFLIALVAVVLDLFV